MDRNAGGLHRGVSGTPPVTARGCWWWPCGTGHMSQCWPCGLPQRAACLNPARRMWPPVWALGQEAADTGALLCSWTRSAESRGDCCPRGKEDLSRRDAEHPELTCPCSRCCVRSTRSRLHACGRRSWLPGRGLGGAELAVLEPLLAAIGSAAVWRDSPWRSEELPSVFGH